MVAFILKAFSEINFGGIFRAGANGMAILNL